MVHDSDAKVTDRMWSEAKDIVERILSHRFNRELATGALPIEVFREYVSQDILYLREETRVLALIAGRADHYEETVFLLRLAVDGLETERIIQRQFVKTFQIEPATGMNSACQGYCEFLATAASDLTYEESVAAALPCYWIYLETGIAILRQAVPDNPYQLWVDTYSGDEFEVMTREFVDMVEAVARRSDKPTQDAMVDAFRQSAQYELDFFSSFLSS